MELNVILELKCDKIMSIEFLFIWGFLIGIGVGALIGLTLAKRIVNDVIKKELERISKTI